MKRFTWCIACLVTSSCNIYNSSFDCPPGKGVGCASVGEVLDLIVEREQGEDLFVYDKGTALLLKQEENEKESSKTSFQCVKSKSKLVLIQKTSGELVLVEESEQ